MYRKFETELAGRKLTVETGRVAELANGDAIIHYGDTVVMVNVTASKEPREGIDFFPLSVDYEEKLYAVGKIPGSFQKREGKPADKAILTSRAIVSDLYSQRILEMMYVLLQQFYLLNKTTAQKFVL